MPTDVLAFLATDAPRFSCLKCFARAMQQDETNVAHDVNARIVDGRAESAHGKCPNCNAIGTVVRARSPRRST